MREKINREESDRKREKDRKTEKERGKGDHLDNVMLGGVVGLLDDGGAVLPVPDLAPKS